MREEIVVFLGPTLAKEEAATHLSARYCPPAEQGSVFRVVRASKPRAIVLIDGAFAKVPAVRHKELLWAMSQGIPIYGAASMGALRAAELALFGMRGHGFIYRWYRATPLADDDEVAVAMSPSELGSQPLSEALINMRLTLRHAERHGILAGEVRRALEGVARSIHFVQRTYPSVLEKARAVLPQRWLPQIDAVERSVSDHLVDQKKADAVALLRWLADRPDLSPIECLAAAPFRMTEAWAADLDAAGLYEGDFASSGSAPA
jgi:hypothetical protein